MTMGQRYRRPMLAVLNHIQRNLDEPLTLGALAGMAHISPFHFHRLFRGLVSEGVAEHIRRLRLERAGQQLHYSDRPVTDIAFEAAYESLEGFSRAFRAQFGMSPSDYREKGKALLPQAPSGIHFNPHRDITFLKPIDGDQAMNVRIETLPAMDVLFVRRRGPYNETAPSAFRVLMDWLDGKGLLESIERVVGHGHDDPHETPSEHLTYDACVELSRPVEPDGEVTRQSFPGGRYAILEHQGSYTRISDSYAKIYGLWLPGSDEVLRNAPCLEIYLNDPCETPEAALKTDLCVALED